MIKTVVGAIVAPTLEHLWKLGGNTIAKIKQTYKQVMQRVSYWPHIADMGSAIALRVAIRLGMEIK